MDVVAWALLVAAVAVHAWCLQVIPERSRVVAFNEKYVTDLKFYVNRHGRKSKYYINVESTVKQAWTNNVSTHFIFYEYLHNEYKRSFVEMHFKYCDLINKDPYIGQAIAASGMTCPMKTGHHSINNITVPAEKFPNVWPFERCMVDIKVNQSPTEDLICHLEIYLHFKQKSR